MAQQDPFDGDGGRDGGEDRDDEPAESGSFASLLRSLARTPQLLARGTQLADGRFKIVRELGHGGMGTVYEAHDSSRQVHVALKTLTRCGPQELYRLKNEFRSLADVAHPNLVALHDFVCDDSTWFFTMDLLRGESFLSYVRGREHPELAQTQPAHELGFDEARLRSALAQLVEGVCALHQAGKLHCDLKPGNVIVTASGELTILDFGLVSERSGPSTGHTLGPEWAGTPGYMAPEQVEGRALTTATDYYAIGVMLYETLTGHLPFGRTPLGAQGVAPVLPPKLSHGPVADLAILCLELLAADPQARPSERSLIERARSSQVRRPSIPKPAPTGLFVGRGRELAQLLALHERPSTSHAVVISGPSGIGKTRLASELIAAWRERGDCLVLEGRCYERESLPYNALDSLIDALSRYLRGLSDLRAAALMPRDAQLLAELFPVLGRIACVAAMPAPARLPPEPLARRRRAFAALKELLSRMSDVSPLVLCIDDFQWADEDSLQLLEAVLAEPGPPPLLLLGVCLSPNLDAANKLQALCERQGVGFEQLELAPLEVHDTLALIDGALSLPGDVARRMALESNGNPFFLGELIAAGHTLGDSRADLRQVILGRASKLSASVRSLLDLLCVAGGPIELGVALNVAGLAEQSRGLVTELRNERWLRLDPGRGHQRVEIYHERIRSLLLESLDVEQRRHIQRRLAECLEAQASVDHEVVATYWLQAGAADRAAASFARAAGRAEKNLAFVSAARLYEQALAHGSFALDERRRLRLAMAAMLERAGHAVSAAQAYLAAAEEAEHAEAARELRRNAAQLLLASGSLESGIAVLRSVLIDVGLDYPEQPDQALAWSVAARAELEARGFEHEPHDGGTELVRLQADACWAAGPTLGSYDFVRAGYFAARGLLLAFASGDTQRVARALAMYATSVASGGDITLARELAQRSLTLAQGVGDTVAQANAELVLGQVSLFAGELSACIERCDRALGLYRTARAGESLEVHLCSMFSNMALHMSGRVDELVARSQLQLVEARERGHLLAEASLRVLGVALGHLVRDELEQARRQGEQAAELWRQDAFHGERFKVLRLEAWCDLYEGQGTRAWQRFADARAQVLASLLLSSRYWRVWWFDLTAATALAAAAEARDEARAALLGDAERAMGELEGTDSSYVRTHLLAYRAAVAHLRGDHRGARDGLRALCASTHTLLAACAQAKLGALLGGPEGAALDDQAMRVLRPLVKCPERWLSLLLPGFHTSA